MSSVNLEKLYTTDICKALLKELDGVSNIHSVPAVEKVVVNVGVGKIASMRRLRATSKKTEQDLVEDIADMLQQITGQKPQVIISKKSIAGFKLRAGNVVGLSVTLRGKRMYDLLARLMNVGLPRTRDFRGIKKKAVDKEGNLTVGIRDMTVFPELASALFSFGCQITLVTNTNNKEHAYALYDKIGIPFEKDNT